MFSDGKSIPLFSICLALSQMETKNVQVNTVKCGEESRSWKWTCVTGRKEKICTARKIARRNEDDDRMENWITQLLWLSVVSGHKTKTKVKENKNNSKRK